MPELDPILVFVTRLNESGISYMITGSVAVISYGEPRLTHDMDVVAGINRSNLHRLPEVFPMSDFYCPPIEILRVEAARPNRGHLNIIHHLTGFKADVYPVAGALHQWAIARKREMLYEGETMWLAPPEYVILRKLEYHREGGGEKHLRDIQTMLENRDTHIDLKFVDQQSTSMALAKQWKLCRQAAEDAGA